MNAEPGHDRPGAAPATIDAPLPEALSDLVRRAEAYFAGARAPNTIKAYGYDLARFAAWCEEEAGGLSPLPADPRTVALYITDLAGRGGPDGEGVKAATLQRRLASIAQLHREAGLEDPTKATAVRNTYRGILREIGSYQEGKAPMVAATVRRVFRAFEHDRGPAAIRDRAIILLGLAGGYRTAELVSLLVEDVEFVEEGAVVLLRSSKTDQAAAGAYKGIPYGEDPTTCPVSHLSRWIAVLRGRDGVATRSLKGPLFRAVGRYGTVRHTKMARESITRMVARRAVEAGLPPGRYSGHSLRAGLVTGAAEMGVPDNKIMEQSKHKTLAALNRYKRTLGLFDDNAASYLGL